MQAFCNAPQECMPPSRFADLPMQAVKLPRLMGGGIRPRTETYVKTCMYDEPRGLACIQWNLSITDTFGDQHFVRYSKVSPTQGLPVYFR